MKSRVLTLLLLSSLIIFTACKSDKSDSTDLSATTQQEEKLEVGKEQLLEINKFELEMENKRLIKFSRGISTIVNGVTTTQYRIEYIGRTNNDIYMAKDYLIDYVKIVENFLSDYPEDQYFLTSREELKLKIKLAKNLIERINNY